MNLKCIYCGLIGLASNFEADHVIPLSRGGSNSPANLRWVCSGCNRQKGNMTPEEYVAWRIINWQKVNYGPIGGERGW